MKIVRNLKREQWILNRVKAHLEEQGKRRGEGWHASDLVFPRKGYWRRVDPKPITDAEAGFFTAGRAHHEVYEAILEGSGNGKPDGGERQWEGIYYSVDLRDQDDRPGEFKTSRSPYDPQPGKEREKFDNYLRQLTIYQAIEDTPKSNLDVFFISLKSTEGGTIPTFRSYEVSLSEEERKKVRASMLRLRDALEVAKKKKNHRALPLCPLWLCRGCQWKDKCQPWRDTKDESYLALKKGKR